MIKNIILDFDKDPEKVVDEDLYSYSGRKNIEKVLSVEAIVNTTKLSLSALGDFFINLQKLRLDNSTITTVRDIGCTFKNLRYLSLNNCGITSLNGISTLSQNIEELYLQKNLIKDVSDLMGMEQLRILDLTDNQIADAANLQFLSCCSNLKMLYFGGNPAIKNPNFQDDSQKFAPQLNIILKQRQEKKENYQKIVSTQSTNTNQNVNKKNASELENQKEQNKSKNYSKYSENISHNHELYKNNDMNSISKHLEKNDKDKEANNVKKQKKGEHLATVLIQKKDNNQKIDNKSSNQKEQKNIDLDNKLKNETSSKNEKSNKNEILIREHKIDKKRKNEERREVSNAMNNNNNEDNAKDDKKKPKKEISKQNETKSKEISDIDDQKINKNKQKMDIIDLIYNNKPKNTRKENKNNKNNTTDAKNESKSSALYHPNNVNSNSMIESDKANEIPGFEDKKNEQKNEVPRSSEITEFELVRVHHKRHKRHHSVNNNSREEKSNEKAQDSDYINNQKKMEQKEKSQISKTETKTEKQIRDLDSMQTQSNQNKDKDNFIFKNINNERARKKIENEKGKEIKIPTENKNSSRININSKNIEKLESRKIESNSTLNEESNPNNSYIDNLEANSSKFKTNSYIINSKESKNDKENELKKKVISNSCIDEIKTNSSNHKKSDSDKINKSEKERKSQKRNSINCPDSELLEILQKPGTESSKKKKYSNDSRGDHLSSQKDHQSQHNSKSQHQQQQNLFKPSPPQSPQNDDTDKQNSSNKRPLLIGPTKIKNKTDPYSSKSKNDLNSTKQNGTENETENFASKGHQKSSEKLRSSSKQVEEMFTHEEKSFFDPSKQKQDQIRVRASRTPSELAYNKRSSQKKVDNSSFDNFIFHNNNNITADFSAYKPKSNKIDTFDFTGDFDLILDKKAENTNSSRRQKSKNGFIDENSHSKAKKDIEIKRIKRSPSELSDSFHQKVESKDFDDKNASFQKSTLPPIDQSLYPNSSRGKKSSQTESLLVDDNSDDGATSSKRPGSKLSSRLATVTPTTITTTNGTTQKYLMPSPRSKIIARPL